VALDDERYGTRFYARADSATRTSAYRQQRTGFTASDPENDVPSAVRPVRLTEVELHVIPWPRAPLGDRPRGRRGRRPGN
jgi:hypothetical protein